MPATFRRAEIVNAKHYSILVILSGGTGLGYGLRTVYGDTRRPPKRPSALSIVSRTSSVLRETRFYAETKITYKRLIADYRANVFLARNGNVFRKPFADPFARSRLFPSCFDVSNPLEEPIQTSFARSARGPLSVPIVAVRPTQGRSRARPLSRDHTPVGRDKGCGV